MRYILRIFCLFIGALLGTFTALSQTGINVKSFKETPNDMDARIHFPVEDLNGKKCALVKVVTTEGDFTFDNGSLGVMKAIHKPELSEWWVYMPAKTMKLKIMHPVLGQLNDTEDGYYYFPNQLREATCYRMELTTLRKTVTYEQERVKTGFLVINTNPEGAQVYLTENGEEKYIGNTPIQKKIPYGTYNYRIKKSMYHDDPGVAVIDSSRVEHTVDLRPAFGSLRVTSTPNGATVTLDNDTRTYTTPCLIEKLVGGELFINITAPRFAIKRQSVTIVDGQETPVDITLNPRFARVAITTLPGAAISINGSVKATGSYAEEMEEGIYDIEVSLAGHRNVTRQIEVSVMQPQEIAIHPTPIYGSLDIVTTPMHADITIDGKSYGTTPTTIDKLLIGTHDVVLSKQGCATVHKQVEITENNLSVVDTTLTQGCEVSITDGVTGNKIYIDNVYTGDTPYRGTLSFGKHTIELRQGNKIRTQEIELSTTDTYREVVISWGFNARWASNVTSTQRKEIEQLFDNMVLVEGGTFRMGGTREQGSDVKEHEKRVRNITLSNFYICKYEVTQALWEAVMGTSIEHQRKRTDYSRTFGIGDNYPMYYINHDDAINFCRRISELTGMNFRLPTEAEWEYAARGGNKSQGYKYSGSNKIDNVAWYSNNAGFATGNTGTHPVGTKQANELGLYDMSGNVYEWCNDWFNYYSNTSEVNPIGPDSGSNRVLRGGSWPGNAKLCRVSDRSSGDPTDRYSTYGFRLVCVP